MENNTIDVTKITPNLAYFADKYDIPFLLQLCCFYFSSVPITEKNILDMVKIANLGDHDKLFRKISLFCDKNRTKLKEIPGLKELMKNNPRIGSKLVDILMFQN